MRMEASNVFLLVIARRNIANGLCLGTTARMMGVAPSWLYHLDHVYQRGGWECVMPNLSSLFLDVLSTVETESADFTVAGVDKH